MTRKIKLTRANKSILLKALAPYYYQEKALGHNTENPGRLILKIDSLPADNPRPPADWHGSDGGPLQFHTHHLSESGHSLFTTAAAVQSQPAQAEGLAAGGADGCKC